MEQGNVEDSGRKRRHQETSWSMRMGKRQGRVMKDPNNGTEIASMPSNAPAVRSMIDRDAILIERIRKYLNQDKTRQYIDIDDMARSLHISCEEYRRLKFRTFRASVELAFDRLHRQVVQLSPEALPEQVGDERNSDSSTSSSSTVESIGSPEFQRSRRKHRLVEEVVVVPKDVSRIAAPIVRGPSLNDAMSNLYSRANKADENAIEEILIEDADEATSSSSLQKNAAARNPVEDSTAATPSGTVRPPLRTTTSAAARRAGIGLKRAEVPVVTDTGLKFKDVGGMEGTLREVCKLLIHLKHPEVYLKVGVTPPRGFLLHGPPGCGKTLLAGAIAGQLRLPLIKIAATEVVSGVSGESESRIRDLFDQAADSAPCVLFIDEIDAITQRRDSVTQRGMEGRIVGQLLACLDDLNARENGDSRGRIVVIGATNRPDSLDPALRRAGRFEREIALGIPDEAAREQILRVLASGLNLGDFDFRALARLCPGYVGADLKALCREAAICAVNRVFRRFQETRSELPSSTSSNANRKAQNCKMAEESLEELLGWLEDDSPVGEDQLSSVRVEMADFQVALATVQPSAKREGFATVPDVTWDDIGALNDLREELEMSILAPVNHPEATKALGLEAPTGILLCGPPGCGKTLLAKAVANQAGINFISVKGPELLNMYVGESERAVRQVFQRAKNSSPCVIFFDELDALCPRRGSGPGGSGGGAGDSSARVVNQLLTELDGMESRRGVFVMGATNRVDIIDPAVLRPGRLQKVLFVDLPTPSDRVDILRAITKHGTRPMLAKDVDFDSLAHNPMCQDFTGADMTALVKEAAVVAFKEHLAATGQSSVSAVAASAAAASTASAASDIRVSSRHFNIAFSRVRPSVNPRDRKRYDAMKRLYCSAGLGSGLAQPEKPDSEEENPDNPPAGSPGVNDESAATSELGSCARVDEDDDDGQAGRAQD